tara:strand:- start:188 stop:775 length:588 start_codon:yes stop_codon:yes gene_type:complete
MAIDTGLGIGCTDLQATGGIRQILLREWATGDTIVYGAANVHSITSIKDTGGTDADWGVYEFKNETPALTINATKENGSTAFECGLSFNLPKLELSKLNVIQDMLSACMMVIAVDTNGKAFVLGVSEKYENESVAERSQTYAQIASAEGGSGAAYSDENGVTINLMARQYEMPREYVPSGTGIVVAASGLTATTD